jgi:3-methylcrotonyl-CoA carboxylase alpha subunit
VRIGLRHNERHLTLDLRKEGETYRVTTDSGDRIVRAEFLDDRTLLLDVDGQRLRLDVLREGDAFFVAVAGQTYTFVRERALPHQQVDRIASPEIVAPMPGKVIRVFVKPGDHVAAGDTLFILEAMKMENRLTADAEGVVERVDVGDGDLVDGGQILAVISYPGDDAS